jgi:Ca2+-binding EF-hand superfamily protein
MGNQAMTTLAPHTVQRSRRASVKNDQARLVSKILETYDADRSNSLNHAEVLEMCLSIAGSVAPNIPITDADVEMVMRVGGPTAKAEITAADIPAALSAVLALKSENEFLHNLFVKYDHDQSGYLPRHQLSEFLTEINDGFIPCSFDLDYILEQCDLSHDGGIHEAEIKAATTAWYCLMDEAPLPKTTEEARALGYTQEQIDNYLAQKKLEYEAEFGTQTPREFKEVDLGYAADGSFKERKASINEPKEPEGENKSAAAIPAGESKQAESESKEVDLGWDASGRLANQHKSIQEEK